MIIHEIPPHTNLFIDFREEEKVHLPSYPAEVENIGSGHKLSTHGNTDGHELPHKEN